MTRLADRLAARHGEDTRKARTAGMLHDLARLYSAERLIEECERRGMPIDAFERAHPIVLHARLGAEIARERFGVRRRVDTLGDPQAHRRGAGDVPGSTN